MWDYFKTFKQSQELSTQMSYLNDAVSVGTDYALANSADSDQTAPLGAV